MIRLPLVLLFSIFVVGAAGCCVTPPPVERYFDRLSPIGATNFFRYALDTRRYDQAYECLSSADRERIGLWKFEGAAMIVNHPEYDLKIRDYITGCIPIDMRMPEKGRAVVETYFDQPGLFTEEELHLVLEGDEWRIDLEATLMAYQQ